jgi:hypothetical protein
MIALWALTSDVCMLEAPGLTWLGGARALLEWAAVSVATGVLGALLFAGSRSLRLLAATFYALVLSIGFGAAGVLGVMHAFGGPDGNLGAPAWALAALGLIAALCVLSLLATAALIVAEVRAGDAEEEIGVGAAADRRDL